MRKSKLVIKKNPEVKLKIPHFTVDEILSPKLNLIPLTRNLNKHFACAFIGRAGSGKTSLALGMLGSSDIFKRVFDNIYAFVPPNSRASIKKNVLQDLPDDQIYDELTTDNLIHCFERVEQNAKESLNSLILFDDVQQFLKGDCEPLLVHMINNRRHNRVSLMVIAQSYGKIPKAARQAFTDVFLFNLSKADYAKIYEELVSSEKDNWERVLTNYSLQTAANEHSFLYFNTLNQSFFINWNECLFDEGQQESDEDVKTAAEGQASEL